MFSDKTVAVRLGGPLSRNGTGRVHVFYNGAWGVMSSYGWDINNAKVVCRELGYKYAIKASGAYYDYHYDYDYDYYYHYHYHYHYHYRYHYHYHYFHFSQICLSDVVCTGNEQLFSDCSYGRWTNSDYCWYFDDLAGVECSSTGDLTTMFYMYNQISKFKTHVI